MDDEMSPPLDCALLPSKSGVGKTLADYQEKWKDDRASSWDRPTAG